MNAKAARLPIHSCVHAKIKLLLLFVFYYPAVVITYCFFHFPLFVVVCKHHQSAPLAATLSTAPLFHQPFITICFSSPLTSREVS